MILQIRDPISDPIINLLFSMPAAFTTCPLCHLLVVPPNPCSYPAVYRRAVGGKNYTQPPTWHLFVFPLMDFCLRYVPPANWDSRSKRMSKIGYFKNFQGKKKKKSASLLYQLAFKETSFSKILIWSSEDSSHSYKLKGQNYTICNLSPHPPKTYYPLSKSQSCTLRTLCPKCGTLNAILTKWGI